MVSSKSLSLEFLGVFKNSIHSVNSVAFPTLWPSTWFMSVIKQLAGTPELLETLAIL